MRRLVRSALPSLTLATLLAVAAQPASAQDAVAAETEIAGVVVYQDRALVTRRATVPLGEGLSRVVIEHLPASLDDRSLRGTAAGALILGLDIELVHLTGQNRDAVRAAEAEYRRLALARQAVEMELREAEALLEMLRSLRATTAERTGTQLGAGAGLDIDGMRKVLELVRDEGAKARENLLALAPLVEDAQRAEEAAKQNLETLRSGGGRTEKTIVATLQPAGDGTDEGVLELSYVVPNASWEPVYDLRVDDAFGAAQLEIGAFVRQSTGEDWTDVPLELTTAEPAAGASPPEPTAWIVDLLRPSVEYGLAAPAAEAGRPAAKRAVRMDAAADDKDMEMLEVRVRRSGVVVAFRTHKNETVESDGQPARVSLGAFDMEPGVRWTAYPRATPKVYVTTKLKNETGTPLPAGAVRVYVGPDFVGPHALGDWGLGEEIEIGLGVDRLVEVTREARISKRETEGIFSKDRVHKRAFNIRVANHRDREIDVRLLDNLPVSRDEDLDVELTRNSLAVAPLPKRETEQNEARGVLEWHFPLGAGMAKEIDFAFQVTHSEDDRITGLGD